MKDIKEHWAKWIYWFMLFVAIIILYKILDNFTDVCNWIDNFFDVIGPFLAGLLLAYLLYLPSKKIETSYKKAKLKIISKHARPLSIITIYTIIITLIIISINFIVPVLTKSVVELTSNFQGYYEVAMTRYEELPEDSIFKSDKVNQFINEIQNIDLTQYINIDQITKYAKGAMNMVSVVFNIFVTFVVSVYALLERTQILKGIKKVILALVKKDTYRSIGKYFNSTNQIFFKFIASQFVDAIVVGILTTIAMSILKIKYAPLLGFMIGLANMIPYFGAIVAVVIAIIITLITGGLSQAIWMAIVVIILQQIDANIINPKIVGDSLKISPLIIILAVTVGGAYFGVLGMFLAVPVAAVLKILIDDYIDYKIKIRFNKKN